MAVFFVVWVRRVEQDNENPLALQLYGLTAGFQEGVRSSVTLQCCLFSLI